MGNCLFGGLGDEQDLSIKVIKSDGGVLEYYSPVTAGSVYLEFSGHAIFSALDILWKPLPHHHHLVPGQSYYLLPNIVSDDELKTFVGNCHVRSNSESLPAITPYRMSLDYNHRVLKRSYTDVFSRNIDTRTRQKEKRTKRKRTSNKGGIWKAKLVINTEELLQILSEDGRTNELIETVRAVAKGENDVASSITSGSSEIDLSVVHV
ncbi:hypothetical protein EUTSA_v10023888mg [Eutrema salsugineum]|uniref:Uncharacterized protein n=1 Tax=Eutrema salsugineum TaxID=72664 RepID=V4KNI0_EUTSA|nr:uncharacterized protein LOC18010278 [Eutrema salsugineum]ESQ28878.1 hypothetical protein EUTSA_v10023888mg [Eutrema salsugineum]